MASITPYIVGIVAAIYLASFAVCWWELERAVQGPETGEGN